MSKRDNREYLLTGIVTALIWIVVIIGGVVAGILIFLGLFYLFHSPRY